MKSAAPSRPRRAEPDVADAPVLRVAGVAKRFRRESGAVTMAVDDVSFDLAPAEIVVLLGPSGCGKSTLLRMIAGLETPDAGTVDMRGHTVFSAATGLNVPTERRHISMIFQSYALWPHMTVAQNIAYPLKCQRKLRRAEIDAAVARVLALVHIPELGQQYPGQMSGGQQQRVALARALVSGTELILFDEPLSNVDAQVREQLRLEMLLMQQELGFSAVYVTHDQSEAMGLAGRIAVMDKGRIVQLGTPREVYDAAATRYVANFVGTSNELPGVIMELDGRGGALIETALGRFSGSLGAGEFAVGDTATVLWRPEHATVTGADGTGPGAFRGTVRSALFLGPRNEFVVDAQDHEIKCWSPTDFTLAAGDEAAIRPDPGHCRILKG
ncbi:ABC transporter ATP-binding protein [Mycolicibacterium sp.]|uniref:ABC transporter ATP-binding protein n=1 Tax=Mycolicibacterium sp. TaxID=2320850 RepID=UPI003D0964B6